MYLFGPAGFVNFIKIPENSRKLLAFEIFYAIMNWYVFCSLYSFVVLVI